VIDAGREPAGAGLRRYFEVIRRRKWIVLAVLIAAVSAAAALSLVQEKKYNAESKILIGQGGTLPQVQFGNTFQVFVATMADLLQSEVVAQGVVDDLNLKETPAQLLRRVSVSQNPQTAVLKLSVTDSDPDQAVRINNEMGQVFGNVVQQQFGKAQPAAGDQPAQPPLTATVFDPAHASRTPVSPRPVRNVALAFVLGLILGLLAAFLREHFDRVLRTRESIEESLGIPVIGQVPFVHTRRRDWRGVFWGSFGEGSESFRALRANLQYLAVKRPLQTILITSAAPEQGKTTVASNLAVAIARSGATAVVIEGDLRRPRLEEAYELDQGGPGLTRVLVGAVGVRDALQRVDLGSRDGTGDEIAGQVSLLPSGPLPPNPSELLSSMQMRDVIEEMAHMHDYVLIDSPPLLVVADALELARMVDGVILVIRRNRATSDEVREVRQVIERLGIHLLGAVITDVESAGVYGSYGDKRTTTGRRGRKSKDRTAGRGTLDAPSPPRPREPALVDGESGSDDF
jgi:receptor protein-tyrosine kinase